MLLTELALDEQDLSIYDISSIISVGENNKNIGQFKCYLDHVKKTFYIEINGSTPLSTLTRSTLLRILDHAEIAGAKNVFVAFRKDTQELEKYLRLLLFVGFQVIFKSYLLQKYCIKRLIKFQVLDRDQQQLLSMTHNHIVLKYDLCADQE